MVSAHKKKGIKGYPELISKVEDAEIFNSRKINNTRNKLDIPVNNLIETDNLKINLEI